MKKYTLSVTSPEYWSEIHDALIVDSNKDGIPDRQVTCTDSKNHSPTRGTYELTEEEASQIAAHPHVNWIELSPDDYPDLYPKFKRIDLIHPSELNEKIYKTKFNNKPIILGNWNHTKKGKHLLSKLIELTKNKLPEEPILVVWPEVALPLFLNEEEELLGFLGDIIPDNVILITGSLRRDFSGPLFEIYNS